MKKIKSAVFYLLLLSVLIGGCKNKSSEKLSKEEKQKLMENKENRVSPPATTINTIDGNTVTINYGSPRVKGRVIWGGLVPYGQVWRTGANEATTIGFSKDVMIDGQLLKKDIYALFTIPEEKEWTVIFNLDETQWGAFKYSEAEDALRIKVIPVAVDSLSENLTFYILPDSISGGGIARLRWEKLQVDFSFKTAPEK